MSFTLSTASSHSGRGKHNADGAVIRWCFADANLAEAIASRFGTQRIIADGDV